MILSELLASKGMDANATLQPVANNPNAPAPAQEAAQYLGGNVQYISGPTAYFVIAFFGQDPNVPGT